MLRPALRVRVERQVDRLFCLVLNFWELLAQSQRLEKVPTLISNHCRKLSIVQ
jgi:hypothetical protein